MARLIETITEYREQPDCKTAAQMELICCEEAPALVCCEIARPWDGYSADEVFEMLNLDLDNEGRDSEGRYVYIEFAERTQPCGEEVIDYDLTPGNCCDDVEPIEIDRDATPDILPARYSINIYWDGGRYPITVTTSNGATYFANYKREVVITGGTYLELFATEFFCGSTDVSFSDGCTTDSIGIRSDQGQWVLQPPRCMLGSAEGTFLGSNLMFEAVSGMWKQHEQVNVPHSWGEGGIFCEDLPLWPGELPPCLSGIPDGCSETICDYVKSIRPTSAVQDTCMTLNPADVAPMLSTLCPANGGAVIGPRSDMGSSYNCDYVLVGGGKLASSGTTAAWAGFYLTTYRLSLYKWVC